MGEPRQECEYNKTEKKIKWKLGSMKKGSESSIRVKLNLGQEKGNHKRELGPLRWNIIFFPSLYFFTKFLVFLLKLLILSLQMLQSNLSLSIMVLTVHLKNGSSLDR